MSERESVEEIIQVRDRFYILASSTLTDDRVRVLKHGNTFAVFDRYGDVHPLRLGEQGVYHSETRYLSRLELKIDGLRPFLLSSSVLEDNTLLAVDLTNPDIIREGRLLIPRGRLHLFRSKFLWNGICFERLRVWNYDRSPVETRLSFAFDNDFADIFEVRGAKRPKRGEKRPAKVTDRSVVLAYRGVDSVERETEVEWSLPENGDYRVAAEPNEIVFHLSLPAKGSLSIQLDTRCIPARRAIPRLSFDQARERSDEDRKEVRAADCRIRTSNEQFNHWVIRSYSDIHMMTTRLPEGLYPYAGVPWFSTVFGRDGILTALFYLWVNPKLAKGVLSHLAAYQAKEFDAEKDVEPGKILHETRKGEMAELKEVPFGLYYGSVDVTPLFIVLAGAYFDRTGDETFLRNLWPNIEMALTWIKEHGDRDRDGFVEYGRRSPSGLLNQGWKDSDDSVFHADGTLADGPIALCEVQGYVYDALRRAARMAKALGHHDRAKELDVEADDLRKRFDAAFWSEEMGMYVLALDGEKKPCRVRTSNAGHCLFSGIASPARAARMAEVLTSPEFFSGWGIRTVASSESLYNPMSYHNGSVWPHDNALIAAGLARYGFREQAAKVATGLFDASVSSDLHRLPELFCGFHRRPGEGPTLYPVACSPQAWASASVFLGMQAMMGLSIDGVQEKIHFNRPVLPPYLREITIRDLAVGSSTVDLELTRHDDDVAINVLARRGNVEIVSVK